MKDCSRTAEHSAVQTPGCRMRRIVSWQCSLTHPNTNPRCFPPVQHHASKDLTWPRRAPWYSHVGGTETWVADETRYRKLTNSAPSLDGQYLSLGAARPVCDSEFAGQPGQMLGRCPERRVGDKGGSEQRRIDPPNASAVQLA